MIIKPAKKIFSVYNEVGQRRIEKWLKTQVITTGMVRFLNVLKLTIQNPVRGSNVIVTPADLWMLRRPPGGRHIKHKNSFLFHRVA